LWDIESGEQLWSAEMKLWEPDHALAFDRSGSYVWVCGSEETVKFDLEDGSRLQSYRIGGPKADFSPDFRYLFIGAEDGALNAFDLANGTKLNSAAGIWATNCDVSPDSRFMLLGSYDNGSLRLASISDSKIIKEFPKNAARTRGIFSPDNRLIAQWTGPHSDKIAMPHNVQIFDRQSGNRVATLKGFGGWQYKVAFSPDSTKIATVGSASHKSWQGANSDADNSVRVWDVRSGKLLLKFDGHRLSAYDLAFTPNGRKLVTAGHSGIIRIWDLD
jgi:WD40 repeat protein